MSNEIGYRVVGKCLLVEEIPPPEVTADAGLTWVGAKDDAQTLYGKVLSIGEAVEIDVDHGDIVGYAKYSGVDVSLRRKTTVDTADKRKLRIILAQDVLLVEEV